jgi:DNA polymerase I
MTPTKFDIFLIDGMHALWRTSDAHRMLSAKVDGEEMGTGGIYGFLSMCIRLKQKFGGRFIVCWDGVREQNFRRKMFPQYKLRDEDDQALQETRKEMARQGAHLRDIIASLGVHQYTGKGCEADDVIARLATELNAEADNRKIAIYSGDSDLRQLVWQDMSASGKLRAGCWTISTGFQKDVIYGPAEVFQKHGVKPSEIPLLKALSGDSSDNYPGIQGVGAVKAAALVNQYGSLAKVLKAAKDGDPSWPLGEKLRLVTVDSVKAIKLYHELAIVRDNMPWKRRQGEANQKEVLAHLHRFRFQSLCHPNELNILMKLGSRP